MNKAIVFFIAASLCLTILAVSSGKFASYAGSAATVEHVQPGVGESQFHRGDQSQIYDFGDKANTHNVLLHLTQMPDQDLRLTATPSDSLFGQQGVSVCTHTGHPVVPHPGNVFFHNWKIDRNDVNLWQHVSAWFNSKAEDNYFITIRPPFESDVEYVLVSGDGPTAPVVCSDASAKDV